MDILKAIYDFFIPMSNLQLGFWTVFFLVYNVWRWKISMHPRNLYHDD